MGFWPQVINILKNTDIVLLIADARAIEESKNEEIIKKAEKLNKKIIFVINKSDLLKNLGEFKEKYPGAFFISALNGKGIDLLKDYLENLWPEKKTIKIGLVGYPNVGKSSLLNRLVPHAKSKISHKAGTTRKTLWIRSGRLRFIDSPGVIPSPDKKEKLGIVSAKDPHKIKDPEIPALKIISYLRKKGSSLEKYYGINGKSDYDVFLEIGRKKGYLLKGGKIDEHRTAVRILEDWQKGKIKP